MSDNELGQYQAVNDHLNAIQTHLEQLLPKRVPVVIHGGRFDKDDLKHVATRGTGLFLSLLRLKIIKSTVIPDMSGGTIDASNVKRDIEASLTIGITLASRDHGGVDPRHVVALRLAEFLALSLVGQDFNNDKVQLVKTVDVRNLFNTDIDKDYKVHFWGAGFEQDICFEASITPSPIPDELFLSQCPDVGIDNLDKYQKIVVNSNE